MIFLELAKYLQRLEDTPKRLEMTEILKEMISNIKADEIDICLYLGLGYLTNPFSNPKFNIADKMMVKILSQSLNKTGEQIFSYYEKTGDLGSVFYELSNNESKDITVKEVHSLLLEIANTAGTGSQDVKILKTSKLLSKVNKLSGKFIIRIILGTTRLGYTELTIIDALSKFLDDKKLKKQIEQKYNEHPDIGLIAKNIKEKGIDGLKNVNIEPGIPILLQKAQRVKSFEEVLQRMPETSLEYKLDGTRVQLHFDKSKIIKTQTEDLFSSEQNNYLAKTFTRNLEETTNMYPDLIEDALKNIDADSVILDGEAIGYDKETNTFLPFQVMMQRKRKHNVKEIAKEIPLKYFVFDILYLNGKSLMSEPLTKRREYLQKIIGDNKNIKISEHIETKDTQKLYDYFEEAKNKGLEGLIAKNPTDIYQAGARSYSWIKLKVADQKLLSDSVDCVIIGYYYGRGVRAKFGIGGLLLAVYDDKNNEYKTVSKLGTGLTDKDLEDIKAMCDKYKINTPLENVKINNMFSPDVLIEPKIVIEVGADEITKSPSHSAEYALRFPRLLKVREDKSASQATTITEIKDMYKNK